MRSAPSSMSGSSVSSTSTLEDWPCSGQGMAPMLAGISAPKGSASPLKAAR